MESDQAKVRHIINTSVIDVKVIGEHWFVHFDGSRESLAFCHKSEDTPFAIGDKIKISFERIADALPSEPSV
jgi:hypothetical protein